MIHRKIAGPMRVQSNGANTLDYELDPSPGGSRCKVVLYSIKVLQSSGNVSLGLDLRWGPDGDIFSSAPKVVIPLSGPGTPPALVQGASGTPDTNAADVLGEWLRPAVRCGVTQGTADEWAMIEVWETRKPF